VTDCPDTPEQLPIGRYGHNSINGVTLSGLSQILNAARAEREQLAKLAEAGEVSVYDDVLCESRRINTGIDMVINGLGLKTLELPNGKLVVVTKEFKPA
jgi:hypothetical protein